MVIELLATLLLGQVTVPSVTVPPTSERTIVFTDRNRTYLIGAETGKVQYLDILPAPNPTPDDDDTPDPPPPEPVSYDFAVLVLDPSDASQQPLRSDPSIRDAVKSKGAIFRSILSTEEDVEKFGLKDRVSQNGTPYLVLLKRNGDSPTSAVVRQIGKATREQILEAVK